MALDEPNANDKVFDQDGITFVVEEKLLTQSGGIKVDFIDNGYRSGFAVTSNIPLSSKSSCGSSCGTSSDSCGC